MLAAVLPDSPAVVVLDELPWLAEQDNIFDGALQTAWDRLLSRRPVLLLLLGSDLHMFTAAARRIGGNCRLAGAPQVQLDQLPVPGQATKIAQICGCAHRAAGHAEQQ
ncbi:MAG TPA: hypothetical protein VG164_08945 [Trebonia sp.]|nr:hypothetical protein [Trebonia sp.]